MKAFVIRKPSDVKNLPLEACRVHKPKPAPGYVTIKVDYCGLNLKDLHLAEGSFKFKGRHLCPGHEIVGVVDEVHEGETKFKPGDAVVAGWLNTACGRCNHCKRGNENLCNEITNVGMSVSGGLAEYVSVHRGAVFKAPRNLSPEEIAPLIGSGVTAYRALNLANCGKGDRVGIFGFGSPGSVALQLAKFRLCQVFVVSPDQKQRRLAEEMGAYWTGGYRDKLPNKLDTAIIFSDQGALVPAALANLEKGGNLVLTSTVMTNIPEINYFEHIVDEKTIFNVTNNTRDDVQQVLDLADIIPLYSKPVVYEMDDCNRALQDIKRDAVACSPVIRIQGDGAADGAETLEYL